MFYFIINAYGKNIIINYRLFTLKLKIWLSKQPFDDAGELAGQTLSPDKFYEVLITKLLIIFIRLSCFCTIQKVDDKFQLVYDFCFVTKT